MKATSAAPAEGVEEGREASDDPAQHEGSLFDDASPQLDRFGPLLALSFVTVTLLSLVDLRYTDENGWRAAGAVLVALLIGVTLLLALRASGVSRRWRRGAEVLLAVSTAATLALLAIRLVTDVDLSVLDPHTPSPLWVAIALVTPIAVVRRLLQHRRVTAGTMMGAVAAYLLIALAFCYVMLTIGNAQGGFFLGESEVSTTTTMYFSLVSLTTVGYGDVSPATDLGRYVASMEAVVGQVYLVTFVAMLVGLWIHGRSARR